ncbi:hypothetical protein VOLCADRAFT_116301 [Volvox carteri f. nagariensis]|uniref:Deacetylase sirtuin-type domain-containing protein n=1 Tax=Volvox carteri f. nagariensis TaxID=3068 RepID=D8TL05_VOLCA|nr:uncharacterized protein VOLCADRAFT_116301 [Volvox carteri f. nagariensis]EFJ51650.1 hypothetical protein VOLCADRAFT_116301 [Volvox carteri f. nagariensis]|eukprot:XP_002947060.1 hypothetical protein VOLCADRAFT_116301 [Volvox carteri f. nagariensis]
MWLPLRTRLPPGMSMFSTRNGLYERARKKFKVQDGIKLFTYSFYRQRRAEVQAFFAQIYSEAQASRAATGHYAMAQLLQLGALQRHYTLNIDGLSEVVGMDTWHHERNAQGSTVEMHGNIRQLVCPTCHAVEPLSRHNISLMRAQQPVPCSACGQDQLRFKVMLYDDDEGDCITPEHVFDVLEEDLKALHFIILYFQVCDMVVWAGISFQQSASVEYFRRVRHMLGTLGRLNAVPQVLINPSEEPYFNVLSAMSNPNELQLLDLRETSDIAFPAMAERIREAIMHEEGEYNGSAAVLMNSIHGGIHDAQAAGAAAAAAAVMDEPVPGAAVSPGIETPARSVEADCVGRAAALHVDFSAKMEMPGYNGVKLEADAAPEFCAGIGIRAGSSGPSLGAVPSVDASTTGSTPEPEPKVARIWHPTRSTRAPRESDAGEEAGPLFVDDADDEDYVEGEDDEDGRCRRNGRGRGKGRGSGNRGRGRGRGRSRTGGSGGGSRAGSYSDAGCSPQGQGPLPQGQSSLALLLGLASGTGHLAGGSPALSLLPLAQPSLLALGGLVKSPPQQQQPTLMQAVQQPQLLLFQQQQQQPLQAVQQLQQLVQLQQLAHLTQQPQQQQPSGLELLQRLNALKQLQCLQQQPPTVSLQLPQPPSLQLSQQAPEVVPLQQRLQLQPLLRPVSLHHQPSGTHAVSSGPQQQPVCQDPQPSPSLLELHQPVSQPQPMQGQDLQLQLQRLVELRQHALLQPDMNVGYQGAPQGSQVPTPSLNCTGHAQLVDAAAPGTTAGPAAAAAPADAVYVHRGVVYSWFSVCRALGTKTAKGTYL